MVDTVRALDAAAIAAAAERAAGTWRAGGLVAFPTETVYGLGAAAVSAEAVARVFAAKRRPADHPLIVHLARGSDLDRWARDVPASAWRLAEACWPGPLTLVLRRRDGVLDAVTGGQPTIAVRVPAHPVALALLEAYGDGIAAPSANRFGRVSPTTADHVRSDLADVEDLLVVDGGPCPVGLESTIVDLTGAAPTLLRLGGLELSVLEAVLGDQLWDGVKGRSAGAPRVPGSLARHYAPDTPARSVPVGSGDRAPPDVAVLARRPRPPTREGPWFELPSTPLEAARVLYGGLRHLDGIGAREIWLEAVPANQGWAAIADRLGRAVAPADPTQEPTPPPAAGGAAASCGAPRDANVRWPTVLVVMGSASDWPTMAPADAVLAELGVEHGCAIVSAHRTPERLADIGRRAAERGVQVIIAGAGGAAHLPGMLAAYTRLPVLGVPVEGRSLAGLDSLLSIVQMPRGVPVGTLAIGAGGATNAALLAVAIVALGDPAVAQRLEAYRSARSAAALAEPLPTAHGFDP